MSRPNILLLYTDQQRWDALGANGNPHIHTPHLDRLAARAANFDHCFVQHPFCMPSRLSMLTGCYPSALGVMEMGVPVPADMANFATLFGAYGYHCANIGKLHFLPHANRDHTQPHPSYGFHHREISDEPGVYEDAYRAWVRRRAPDQLDYLSPGLPPARHVWNETMGWADPVKHGAGDAPGARSDFTGPVPFRGRDDVTHSAFVGTRTCDYLRGRAGRAQEPFACIAGFYSPHAPWHVPEKYLSRYDPAQLALPAMPEGCGDADHLRAARQGYYAMVSEVDDQVGAILATLAETGLSENTVVVFTSDHGEWLGEHGRWGKGFPAHDACSRVPLLIAGPGITTRRESRLVEAIDLLPSLVEAAGLPVPTTLQGRSLDLVGNRGGAPEGRRESALTEHRGWRSLRTTHHRYVVREEGREELYDLRAPLGEYHNLAGDQAQAGVLAAHRHELVRRMLGAEHALARTWPY